MLYIPKFFGTIQWYFVVLFSVWHPIALQGLYYLLTFQLSIKTFIWCKFRNLTILYVVVLFLIFGTTQAITAGAHRLWSHRSYKASFSLRLLLGFFHTVAMQFSIYKWATDHRQHHKHTDTDADPQNATRGFFYCHIGWLLVQPHPDVAQKRQNIDDRDLWADPIVYYQYKYYGVLAPLCCIAIPTLVPWWLWNEDLYVAFAVAAILRFLLVVHFTFFVNSAAHLWGNKPYDRHTTASENRMVSIVMQGEGWHNYHHTFPWDYRAAELGSYSGNWSTAFIDFMARIGWAWDRKTASQDVITARKIRTGLS